MKDRIWYKILLAMMLVLASLPGMLIQTASAAPPSEKKDTITIMPDDEKRTFDGTMQNVTVSTGTVLLNNQPLPDNLEVSFEATGNGKLCGIYPNNALYPITVNADSVQVFDNGIDVTKNYEIIPVQGSLWIDRPYVCVWPEMFNLEYTGEKIYPTHIKGSVTINGSPPSPELRVTCEFNGGIKGGTAIRLGFPVTFKEVLYKVELVEDRTDITAYVPPNMRGSSTVFAILPPKQKLPMEIWLEDGTVLVNGKTLQENFKVEYKIDGNWIVPEVYPIEHVEQVRILVYEDAEYISERWCDVTECYELTIIEPEDMSEPKPKIIITPDDQVRLFDGSMHRVTVTSGTILLDGNPLPNDLKVTFEAIGNGRLCEIYPNKALYPITVNVDSVQVFDNGVDVTKNYEIIPLQGSLWIDRPYVRVWPEMFNLEYTGEKIYPTHIKGSVTINGGPPSPELRITCEFNGGIEGGTAIRKGLPVTFEEVLYKAELVEDGTDITAYIPPNSFDLSTIFVILPPKQKIPMEICLEDGTVLASGKTLQEYFKIEYKINGTWIVPEVYPIDQVEQVRILVYEDIFEKWFDVTECYELTIIEPEDMSEPKPKIIITPDDQVRLFDGSMHRVTVTTGTILLDGNPLPNDLKVTFEARGQGRVGSNAGPDYQQPYPITVDMASVQIRTAEGNTDITGAYQVEAINGTLWVKNNGSFYIEPETLEFEYTGNKQYAKEARGIVTFNNKPFSDEVEITCKYTGGLEYAIAPGNYYASYTGYTFKGVVVEDGTDISYYMSTRVASMGGDIKIVSPKEKIPVVITLDDQVVPYTGSEQTIKLKTGTVCVNGNALPSNLNVEFEISGKGTDVGVYPIDNVSKVNISVFDGARNIWMNVNDCYEYTFSAATLTIQAPESAKIPLTIQPDDQTAMFDGSKQRVSVSSGSILADGIPVNEAGNIQVTFEAAGVGRLPGDYPIEVDIASVAIIDNTTGANVTENYEIIPEAGILNITNEGSWLEVQPDNVDGLEFTGRPLEIAVTTGSAIINGAPMSDELGLVLDCHGSAFIGEGCMPVESFSVFVLEDGTDITSYFQYAYALPLYPRINPPKEKIPVLVQPEALNDVYVGYARYIGSPNITVTVNDEEFPIDNLSIQLYYHGPDFIEPGVHEIGGDEWDVYVSFMWCYASDYFDVTVLPTTLTIRRQLLTIEPVFDQGLVYTFDGTVKQVKSTSAHFLLDGFGMRPWEKPYAETSASGLFPGSYPVTLDYLSTDMYDVELTPRFLEISDDNTSVQIYLDTFEVEYTGEKQNITVSDSNKSREIYINGKKSDQHEVTFEASTSATTVGFHTLALNEDSLKVHVKESGLDITGYLRKKVLSSVAKIVPPKNKISVEVLADDIVVPYTGEKQEVWASPKEILINGSPAADNLRVEFKAKASGMQPGRYSNWNVSLEIFVFEENSNTWVDVSNCYKLMPLQFVLDIQAPQSVLTIKPDDQEFSFDGTLKSVTLNTGTVLLEGEPVPTNLDVRFEAHGQGRISGAYPIEVDMQSIVINDLHTGEDVTGKYRIEPSEGTLTIRSYTPIVNITIPDVERPYTGEMHYIGEVSATVTIDGEPISDELRGIVYVSGAGILPYSYPMELLEFKILVATDGEDITHEYVLGDVQFGNLIIQEPANSIPMTIIIDDAVTPYTGNRREVVVDTGKVLIDGKEAPSLMRLKVQVGGSGLEPGIFAIDDIMYGPYVLIYDEAMGVWHIANNFYEIDVVPGKLTVEQHDKMQINIVPDDEYLAFDGSMQSVHVTTGAITLYDEPLPENLQVTFNAYGSGRFPDSEYSIDVDQDSIKVIDTTSGEDITEQYTLNMEAGALSIYGEFSFATVVPNEITRVYNGEMQHVTVNEGTVSINGKPMSDELRLVLTANGDAIATGEYQTEIDNVRIEIIEDGTDVTDYFRVFKRLGAFSIIAPEEKTSIEIKPDDATLPFNGEKQQIMTTSGTVQVNGKSAPNNIRAMFWSFGEGLEPGVYPMENIPWVSVLIYDTIRDAWLDVTECYDWTLLDCTLTIKDTNKIITVRPDDQVAAFDGAMQQVTVESGTVTAYTGDVDVNSLQVTFTASGNGRLPGGDYPITIDRRSVRVIDATSGIDVSNEYGVILQQGTLAIDNTNSTLTITPNDVTLEYTGEQLVAQTSDCVALINNNPIADDIKVAMSARGTGTFLGMHGTTVETYKVEVSGTDIDLTDYFTTKCNPGRFEIVVPKAKIPLSIKPNDHTCDYDYENENEQVFNITAGQMLISGNPVPSNIKIQFVVSGRGKEGGKYPIDTLVSLSVTMYDTLSQTWIDVKECYDVEIIPGVLTIEFYDGYLLSYSGQHTVTYVSYQGKLWEQWALTSSGTLTVSKGKVPTSQVWLCGGGGGGGSYASNGGAGGYATSDDNYVIKGSTAVVIGNGGTAGRNIYTGGNGGKTSIGNLSADGGGGGTKGAGGNGGTGGGRSTKSASGGKGDGKSKIPFNDSVNFPYPHCAGGGGGGYEYEYSPGSIGKDKGGDGGSNGSDGKNAQPIDSNSGGAGGLYGGGLGGTAWPGEAYFYSGLEAKYYGGGGGGGAGREGYGAYYYFYNGGTGYQGVVYIRIPVEK